MYQLEIRCNSVESALPSCEGDFIRSMLLAVVVLSA